MPIRKFDSKVKTGVTLARQLAEGRQRRAEHPLRKLQRWYGNRYVQRLLAWTKKVGGGREEEATPEVEEVIQSSHGGGQALDSGARAQMEPAFGTDFSGVRVHTDGQADHLNRSLSARAFTTGQDIFFKQGEYSPGSSTGRELLAHELTHVVQQSGAQIQPKLVVNPPGDRYEQEADQAAQAVIQQEQQTTSTPDHSLQSGRQTEEEEEPIQTRLVQRQAEEEGEESIQARTVQRQAEEEKEEQVQTRLVQRQAEEEEKPIQSQARQGQAEEEKKEPIQIPLVQRQAATPQTEAVRPTLTKWEDTPEQKAFLEQVLNAHIASSTRRRKQPLPDLNGEELAVVSGTNIKMRTDAANAAGNLIAAANQALEVDKQAGEADAAKTIRISATSGYRERSHQENLWRKYFKRSKGYYERTAVKRAKLQGGEHGDAAVSFMVKYIAPKIAAPGFSNHQAGLAIDLWQERTKGNRISNSTDSDAIDKWHNTWFFHWLQENAATFKFEEYPKEPWHWTYRGTTSVTSRVTAPSMQTRNAPSTTQTVPKREPANGLERAVKQNAIWGPRLGWIEHIDEIVAHFQRLGYLPLLQTPDTETFARAVKEYQSRYARLDSDGIIGPDTWHRLRGEMSSSTGEASQSAP
ncbi:MAG: DUF4157 domain-containing protein [Anaerolineae bacterium]|nr:DUF4157 domain-containing protein [Anaerolineae bacterium]